MLNREHVLHDLAEDAHDVELHAVHFLHIVEEDVDAGNAAAGSDVHYLPTEVVILEERSQELAADGGDYLCSGLVEWQHSKWAYRSWVRCDVSSRGYHRTFLKHLLVQSGS